MVKKCVACLNNVSTAEGASCSLCKGVCHRACVKIRKDAAIPASWKCPDCKAKMPRKVIDQSTPCRAESAQDANDQIKPQQARTPSGTSSPDLSPAPLTQSIMLEQMKEFMKEMRETVVEFREFRKEMSELRELVTSCDLRLCGLEDRMSSMEQQLRAERGGGAEGVEELRKTVELLQLDLNDRDQSLLLNDIEISGVPEEGGENVTHLVMGCAAKLGVTVDERDVVSCERVGIARAAVEGAPPAPPRPRAIVVRLARRDTRDTILRAARVRRGATTEGLGLRSEPRRFYTNERLTRTNRSLFHKARELRQQRGWRFVWTRDGKIFARKDHGTRALRIRTESDLVRVFGPESVSPQTPN